MLRAGTRDDFVGMLGEVLVMFIQKLFVAEDVGGAWGNQRTCSFSGGYAPSRNDRIMDDMICPFSSSTMNFRFFSCTALASHSGRKPARTASKPS